jgi:ATP-binding cassette subfamily B protein
LFGYVEQSFHRVAGTVKDQITLYDEKISMENVKEAAELTGLHDTIMHLPDGYDTICTPELFSQGQWQLLSIARAAAARPKLLLLDEITANLDAETEKEVLEALKRVSENRTVISISHRVSAKMGRIIPIEQKL